ncbi:hypothetical protein BH24ACT2_BH24ACT2_06050 [soil metagenome]
MSRMSKSTLVLRAVVALALVGAVQASFIGVASAASEFAEQQFVDLINQERAAVGKPALVVNVSVRTVARNWTDAMIADGNGCPESLSHNPKYSSQIPSGWSRAAENVACGQSVESLHRALMNSSGHRQNILGAFNQVGVGVSVDARGTMWVTQNFMQHATLPDDDTGGGGGGGSRAVVSVEDASAREGTSDRSKLVFRVRLSAASDTTVTVAYATADGSAGTSDYKAKSGTLTFRPGKTTQKVSIVLKSDAVAEADETFTLTLSNATNATIGDGTATGTIIDDD